MFSSWGSLARREFQVTSEANCLGIWDRGVAAPRLHRAQLRSAECEGGLVQHRQPRTTPGQGAQGGDQLLIFNAACVGRRVLQREQASGIALVEELLDTATATAGELDKLDGQRCRGLAALEQHVKAHALAHEPVRVAKH